MYALKNSATTNVVYAPTIMNSPCARLMTRIRPKMIDRPSASSTRMLPSDSPANVWCTMRTFHW